VPTTVDHEATVAALLARISAFDVDGALELVTDDVENTIAFQPEGRGFWSHIVGREALGRFLGSLPTLFTSFAIWPTEALPLADPSGLVLRYASSAEVTKTGRAYRNTYIGIFRFDGDGRIREWTEFHNPLVMLEAFDRA
jgi:ketosteroid isomerase-like protein